MRVRSVGARLTLWYSGVLTATLILLASVGYGLLMWGLAQDVDASLAGVARAVAESERRGGGGDLAQLLRQFLGAPFPDRFFQLLDPLGRLDPRSPQTHPLPFPLSARTLENAARGLPTYETLTGTAPYPVRLLTLPVLQGGQVTALVQVGMSLEGLARARRRFLLAAAGLLPPGLVLAGVGGWLLSRRALRPVDEMTVTARRIGAGSLAERIRDPGADDELGRLARTLNEMLARLETTFDQMRQFSADAAHELRTPLTALRGEIEIALRRPRDPADYQALLASALEEVHRMSGLVDDLLFLARADGGAVSLPREAVDLTKVAEEAVRRAEVLAEGRGVTLRHAGTNGSVMGDPERLLRLVLNLVDNGIKYTPSGGSVEVSVGQEGTGAVLRVRDTGIGIPPEEQDKIFRRFYRVDRARTREVGGTGLGLCIAQSIAESHRGRITVESAPGRGSTFTVRLPLSG